MPYTKVDQLIARMRFRAAYPHLRAGSRVCDLGCGLEMAFLDFAEDKTSPAALVDPILNVLHGLGLVSDEMESDEHQKRMPVQEVRAMLGRAGFRSFRHRRFELGLNHLMVA